MSELLPARNRLLTALGAADPAAEAQLREGLESVEIKSHSRVMTSDRPIRHVYFPETGVLAVIQQMHDGSAVAVDLVGSDGMVGLAVYLGAIAFPLEAICQAPGTFLRMKAAEFRTLGKVPQASAGLALCPRGVPQIPQRLGLSHVTGRSPNRNRHVGSARVPGSSHQGPWPSSPIANAAARRGPVARRRRAASLPWSSRHRGVRRGGRRSRGPPRGSRPRARGP